jgi:hypothetical protein
LWAGVWQTHFALGQRLLEDKYKSSAAYQTEVTAGNAGSLRLFVPALGEALAFFADYQRGVPTLNMCKTQENGSFPLLWPLGSQSINYRWERKNGETSYLYLQANPAVWLFSFLGFLWALRSWSLAPMKISKEGVLLAVYLAGVLAPLLYDRVFYLYHFFIPLLAGVLAGGLALREIARRSLRLGSLSGAGLLAAFIAAFLFFAPLTYYKPLTDPELKLRAWLPLWNLRCAGCEPVFPIARPVSGDAQRIAISGRKATSVTQGWGVTRMGLTDEEAPLVAGGRLYQFGIGTHANGEMVFSVPDWATRFSSFVGVPDNYKGRATSIQFSVTVDGKEGWRSAILKPGDAPVLVDLPVPGGSVVKLGIHDGGDGITDDHGAWLEPIFK